jgi:hypothetical protein
MRKLIVLAIMAVAFAAFGDDNSPAPDPGAPGL